MMMMTMKMMKIDCGVLRVLWVCWVRWKIVGCLLDLGYVNI